MARARHWMIVCMIALVPVTSHALALGKLKVLSALNEPLNAEIDFTSATEKELKGLSVTLASRADFDAAGVDRLPMLSQIKFVVTKRADGRYFLELRTEEQLGEPFLHLLLQVEWPGGRLVREYTALIDPPYKIAGKAAPVETPVITPPAPEAAPAPSAPVAEVPPAEAPQAAPAEAPKAVEAPKEETPPVAKMEEPKAPEEPKPEQIAPKEEVAKEAPPMEAKPDETKLGPPEVAQGAAPQEPAAPTVEPLEAAPKAEAAPEAPAPVAPETAPAAAPAVAAMAEYNVKKGDTLWKIAEGARADNKDVSVEQVMLAIYRTNKDAFFGNNVNNLKAGKILKMPESEEVNAVAVPQARREFRAQYNTWQEYKLKLAAASSAVKVTEAPEAAPAAETPAAKPAEKPAAPAPTKQAEAKPATPPPAAADKGKQDELLKIVRSTLQQEKSTPDKKVSEKESAREASVREQQALAERAATLEESLESKRLENKDLSEKIGLVRSQLKKESRLIELESQSLAQQKKAAEQKVAEAKPAEPVVKPAEKPAEKPAAVKPEEKIKPEPLPPVAKTAPPKRVPPPPAPPKEEKGFMAAVLEAVQSDLLIPAVIGVVVLLSGGIALVYFRRRQKSIAEFEESILSADAISTEQPATTGTVPGQPAAPATTGGDTSFLSDFSQGGMGNIHTDEVDPIAEAEVYLAYGRDETAEEILKEAMVKNPDRQELKLKLLEIYHQRNDVAAFETLAEELYAGLGGRGGKIWDKVEEMGRKLNPENPMFRGGAPARASAAPATAAPAVKAAMRAAPKAEPAGDFDFDMASSPAADDLSATLAQPAARADAEMSLDSLDLGTPADNAIDFDIGGKEEAEAKIDVGAPEAAPAGNEIQWEPQPGAGPAAEVSLEAPAGGEAQASGQWDETATKLDLAKAYIDMGDAEGARSILQEVMAEGNDTQKKQAQELSAQIA